MDGINPTLAFAALFLGLSGHPRDVAQHPAEAEHYSTWQYAEFSDQQAGYPFDCPAMVLVMDGDDAQMPAEDSGLFQDRRMALAGSILTVGPADADAPSAPGWLSGEIFHDDNGCGALSQHP